MKRTYAILISKLPANYSAHAPDVDGCIATGGTLEEVKRNIQEALAFHFEGTAEDGLPIPEPTALELAYVEVAIPAPLKHEMPAL